MPTANIHDRGSIERVYPRNAFAVDAAENQKQPANALVRGVRIVSAPDAAGNFALECARQHIGEVAEARFLAPYRPLCPAEAAAGPTAPDPAAGYSAFIDEIVAAAPGAFRAADAPGPGDPRLQGPRQ